MRRRITSQSAARLLIIATILATAALSGCICDSLKPATVQPSSTPVTGPAGVLTASPAATATPVATPVAEEARITQTDNGYLVKGFGGEAAQVQLHAGKVSFHIRLPEYAAGDSYVLLITNADGPFTFTSRHEFSGNAGAADLKIDKTIPYDGAYRISLDYDNTWEIDITQ